jgi:hypothetical protein
MMSNIFFLLTKQHRNNVALQKADDRHAVVSGNEDAFSHWARIVAREMQIDF